MARLLRAGLVAMTQTYSLGVVSSGGCRGWHLRCSWRRVLALSGRWSGSAWRPC